MISTIFPEAALKVVYLKAGRRQTPSHFIFEKKDLVLLQKPEH
jgi:hypothetical protein